MTGYVAKLIAEGNRMSVETVPWRSCCRRPQRYGGRPMWSGRSRWQV